MLPVGKKVVGTIKLCDSSRAGMGTKRICHRVLMWFTCKCSYCYVPQSQVMMSEVCVLHCYYIVQLKQ